MSRRSGELLAFAAIIRGCQIANWTRDLVSGQHVAPVAERDGQTTRRDVHG
jgi:hypothetical protein